MTNIEKNDSEKEGDKVVSDHGTGKEKIVGGSNDEEGKDKESSGVDKDLADGIVNVEDMDSDDEPIGRRLTQGIEKRLKNRKGKAILTESQPSKATKKGVVVGPAKRMEQGYCSCNQKKSPLKGRKTS